MCVWGGRGGSTCSVACPKYRTPSYGSEYEAVWHYLWLFRNLSYSASEIGLRSFTQCNMDEVQFSVSWKVWTMNIAPSNRFQLMELLPHLLIYHTGGKINRNLSVLVIWILKPCWCVSRYQCFRETGSLHLQGWSTFSGSLLITYKSTGCCNAEDHYQHLAFTSNLQTTLIGNITLTSYCLPYAQYGGVPCCLNSTRRCGPKCLIVFRKNYDLSFIISFIET